MPYGEGGINETNTAHEVGFFICPRCGHTHKNLVFMPLDKPIQLEYIQGIKFSHSVLCPDKLLPIWLVYDGEVAKLA